MSDVRRYTNKILDLVDERVLPAKDLVRDLLNHMSEAQVQDFYEANLEADCGSLDEDDLEIEVEDDDDWKREQAMEAGMLHGVEAFNDAMGAGTEKPEND